MSYRIHTTTPDALFITYIDAPERYFAGVDDMAVGPSLVLDDGDNAEALVLIGTANEIGAFARRILSALPTGLTDAEEEYLAHVCDMYDYDAAAGSIGRDAAGSAWFLSDEDSTSFDLTNEQIREL